MVTAQSTPTLKTPVVSGSAPTAPAAGPAAPAAPEDPCAPGVHPTEAEDHKAALAGPRGSTAAAYETAPKAVLESDGLQPAGAGPAPTESSPRPEPPTIP